MYHKLSSFLKVALFVTFYWFSANAFAEYYVVTSYPPENGCFNTCYSYPTCGTSYVEIRSSAPYRHAEKSSGQMQEYAWISYAP